MNEIVTLQHGKVITSSLMVADFFNKRHDRVLEAIKSVMESSHSARPFFRVSAYQDSTGRTLPMYEMNRDGFSLIAMGFTGKKALEFKLQFIAAFNRMESYISQQRNPSWIDSRNNIKLIRRDETDIIAELNEYAIKQGSKNYHHNFSRYTNMTYKALEFFAVEHKPIRDFLNTSQLMTLGTAEAIVTETIRSGMREGLHYSEIYQQCKATVMAFAATIPPGMKAIRDTSPQLRLAA